jgi:hypothetical protein
MGQKLHVARTSSCDVLESGCGVKCSNSVVVMQPRSRIRNLAKPRTDVIGEHRAGLGAAARCPPADNEQLEGLYQDANTAIIRGRLPSIVSKWSVADTAAVVVALAAAAYCEAHFFWYVCYHVIHPFRSATPKASADFRNLVGLGHITSLLCPSYSDVFLHVSVTGPH